MLTTDFTGTYDYERGEADNEAEYFLSCAAEEPEYAIEHAARISKHWRKVLSPEGFADFSDQWNKHVKGYPL